MLISSTIRDISERRRASEQRLQLAAIVDSSDDAIIGKALDGTITSWNEGAHCILGYTADEVAVGKPISLLIPPGHDDKEAEIIRKLESGDRAEQFETVRRQKGRR